MSRHLGKYCYQGCDSSADFRGSAFLGTIFLNRVNPGRKVSVGGGGRMILEWRVYGMSFKDLTTITIKIRSFDWMFPLNHNPETRDAKDYHKAYFTTLVQTICITQLKALLGIK